MLKINNFTRKMLIVITCMGVVPVAFSAISLDRTRAIYNANDKSMSLTIANDNKQLPYLAQAWIEDSKGVKLTTGPLIATPPVQRVEPDSKSLVRLSATADINKLPKDRESLFYFNLREIPPKSEKPNTLQIALQTRIKLFFRPESIKAEPNAVWQDQIVLHKSTGGYRIENPTPYYITLIGLGGNEKEAKTGNFKVVMLEPKSEQFVNAGNYTNPWIEWIDDYGGRPVQEFNCKGERCTSLKK